MEFENGLSPCSCSNKGSQTSLNILKGISLFVCFISSSLIFVTMELMVVFLVMLECFQERHHFT